MSTYVSVEIDIQDPDLLKQALENCGLPVTEYAQDSGVYRKWVPDCGENLTGYVRGRNARLVVHGGLDRIDYRKIPYGGYKRNYTGYCGDTAFVAGENGIVAELDTTHGDSAQNWTRVQNEYLALSAESKARAAGWTTKRVQSPDGSIKIRAYPTKTGKGKKRGSRRMAALRGGA